MEAKLKKNTHEIILTYRRNCFWKEGKKNTYIKKTFHGGVSLLDNKIKNEAINRENIKRLFFLRKRKILKLHRLEENKNHY